MPSVPRGPAAPLIHREVVVGVQAALVRVGEPLVAVGVPFVRFHAADLTQWA